MPPDNGGSPKASVVAACMEIGTFRREAFTRRKAEKSMNLKKLRYRWYPYLPSSLHKSPLKFDLGGVRNHDGYIAVNLAAKPAIRANILDLDSFCANGIVDEFFMNHTYEHICIVDTPSFLSTVLRKLKPGGRFRIIHTDAKKVLDMYTKGELDFRVLRDLLFTSYPRRKDFYIKGMDLNGHKYMWGAEELSEELEFYGFARTEQFDAGSWSFDFENYFPTDAMQRFHGVQIPNLGLVAYKAST